MHMWRSYHRTRAVFAPVNMAAVVPVAERIAAAMLFRLPRRQVTVFPAGFPALAPARPMIIGIVIPIMSSHLISAVVPAVPFPPVGVLLCAIAPPLG
jgi:hypothetical protein